MGQCALRLSQSGFENPTRHRPRNGATPHFSMSEILPNPTDAECMRLALEQAELAARLGEVPVGAIVLAPDGRTVLGKGHNLCIQGHDPSAHAEIQAMRQAAQALGNYRLEGCTLYVTLEPCAMCSGAMLHARLAQVVFAVADPRTGAAGSVLDLFAPSGINHQTRARALADTGEAATIRQQCTDLLTGFFRERRQQQATLRTQADKAPLREDALRPAGQGLAAEGVWQTASRWTLVPDPRDARGVAWRIHALEYGVDRAPCVVLLHGYAGCSMVWHEVAEAASQAGWRVLVPDLPGHGLSDKPRQAGLHTLEWHHAMLQAWLDRQALPNDWCLVTLDQSVLLAPVAASPQGGMALYPEDATVRWPDLQDQPNSGDWRLRSMRSPRFDGAAHWSANGLPSLDAFFQASYPDAGHRAALRWQTFAGQGASAVDCQWWQAHGQRLSLHGLTRAPVKEMQPGGRVRAALRHNIPHILHWLEQQRLRT